MERKTIEERMVEWSLKRIAYILSPRCVEYSTDAEKIGAITGIMITIDKEFDAEREAALNDSRCTMD